MPSESMLMSVVYMERDAVILSKFHAATGKQDGIHGSYCDPTSHRNLWWFPWYMHAASNVDHII